MNTRLLRIRRTFMHPLVSPALGRRNVREWVRAVRLVAATTQGWVHAPVTARGLDETP